jgi:hypothetical protein
MHSSETLYDIGIQTNQKTRSKTVLGAGCVTKMIDKPAPQHALAEIVAALRATSRCYALVGGVAVSFRATPRFTRDVDLVVLVDNDDDAEQLVFSLREYGFRIVATVEQKAQKRLGTARLESSNGVIVDLLFANSGIEPEIVRHATVVQMESVGAVSIARAEELLAMKILSMSPKRPQDMVDAQNLIAFNADIDLKMVRKNLSTMVERAYHRDEDLFGKLDALLSEVLQRD